MHLLAHTSSFTDLIKAGKKFDMGIKLGRIEDPNRKREGDSSRRNIAGSPAGNKKGKETTINVVSPGHQESRPFSMNYAPVPPATKAYGPPSAHYPQQPFSAPPASVSTPQQVVHYTPAPPQAQQNRAPTFRPPQQGQQSGTAQPRQCRQFTPLPAPPSHIYRQLLAGNKIKQEAPGANFNPANQDQSRRCEFHMGAPGHTLDNCWRLREKIQELIDAKAISFNAVRPPNVQANPLPNHASGSGPTINIISVCKEDPVPFIIEYVPEEVAAQFAGSSVPPAPFVIEVPAKEPYQDNRVPWTYENSIGNLEQQMSVMGVTRSGRVYENPDTTSKGKAPAAMLETAPQVALIPTKKVTDEEAEAFMKIIKASEYKIVEQMGKSSAHISLLALLLSSEPHRQALLKVLTAAQVPKETPAAQIEETISTIFSNVISFSDDELPSEGYEHSRALHIVCKCNNFIVGRVMIDNGSTLNVCPVSTLKQMNVDFNRIRPSKTAVRAFDGSRRDVNGEIDLLIDVSPCSFAVTFQVLDIPNAFSLLLGRPWIHSAGAVPSSLHQKLKFIVEGKLITVKGEEDYAIYKETAVPYISIGDDQNLPFHSFETISVIKDYGEVVPSRADRMIGKFLL
ncbi:hypothetical protein CDL15_Pgr011718 [Punica granatum]|uniref:Uncharacterized protein n=1 Tax=Punica granatum TaxID=22663 RepID=A0A218WWF9_PUNGR|nr:hypothetical protein CDL15_Pgr011718 [Punica granatum]